MPYRNDNVRDALLTLTVNPIRMRTAIGEVTCDVFNVRAIVIVKRRRALVPAPTLALDEEVTDHTRPRASCARLSGRATGRQSIRQSNVISRFGSPQPRTASRV